jgi:hypothetical protein
MHTTLRIGLAAAIVALGGCATYGFPGAGYPGAGYPGTATGSPYGYGTPAPATGGTIRCESNDDRSRTCPVDTRGGVRLVRQLSSTPCVQGRNWGYDSRGIQVRQGCRGEFQVGAAGYGVPGPGYGTGGVVSCESEDNRRRHCSVAVPRGVTLVRQRSDSPCIQGRTWGWDRGGIWVDRGCRAEFQVY